MFCEMSFIKMDVYIFVKEVVIFIFLEKKNRREDWKCCFFTELLWQFHHGLCHGKELRYIYIEILWLWCCQCNWCSIHDVWKHSAKLHYWHFTIYHSLFWYIISPVFSVFGKGEEVEFFLKNFGGHESFLWGNGYPCCGLLVTSPLGFKARVGSLICTWQRHMCYTSPEIHLWCDTCWPLGSQYGGWAVSSTYLWGIGGTRNRELSCRRSQWGDRNW